MDVHSMTFAIVSSASDSLAIETARLSAASEGGEKSTGHRRRLYGSEDARSAGGGTVMTGHADLRRTFSVTDPRSNRSKPLRPCVPSTTRSAGNDAARA